MIDDLITVITPVYNAEKFIEQTIKSIQNQTYEKWELILVNDCSKDNSEAIIKEFSVADSRIKYINLSTNIGEGGARNAGMDISNGRFIAFVDSDDLWKPEKLSTQLNFMKKNNIGFSFTSYELINENGKRLKHKISAPKEMTYKKLLKNTIIGCSTTMLDRSIVGEFRMPVSRLFVDHPTWFKLLKEGQKAYGLDVILTEYRIVKTSLSYNKAKEIKRKWKMYRITEGFGFWKSLYYCSWNILNAIKKRV